jgi:AraC-like DNA-binding protein
MVRQALEGVDPTVRDAMLFAVTHAHEGLSPEDLAQRLAIHRRTLSTRLERAGFPSTQKLLTWGRLIVAARALEDGRRSAQRIAQALGFPSGSAFRNSCQRYHHATPQEIRSRGGGDYVVRTMLRQMQTAPAAAVTIASDGARRARLLTLAI